VLWLLARRMMDFSLDRNIDVLTFACPKVGNFRAVRPAGLRVVRHVIHRQDIIPLLPPNSTILPFLNFLLTLAQQNALAAWENFSVYQITGDGWGNGLEPAGTRPWQTYADWITLFLTARAPAAFAQHFLASYVAALADCCDAPQYPFSPALWDVLYGTPDNSIGGEMIGGKGTTWPELAAGGLELDGSGVIVPTPDAIILETGEYILLETLGKILKE